MKLNIAERIALLQVLPEEGDFTTLKVLREIQENVGFSEEDHKKYKIEKFNEEGKKDPNGNRIRWDPVEGIKEVEIEFGVKATEIVKDALTKMDSEKKLIPNLFTLFEKFVQDKQEK
jgi:DNA modification methylase